MEFQPGSPKKVGVILAADALQGEVDPCNDHIWRLTSGKGEPVALSLFTTYGLRAYGMRIFPRFHMKNEVVTNPKAFAAYPTIPFQTADFAEIRFAPFPSIDAVLRVWVPTSQVIVGQVTLSLNADSPESLLMEWSAMLEPFAGGRQMFAKEHGVNTILAGKTRDIEPVFLLTGMPGTDASTYPSLALELALRPSVPRQFTWVLASLENEDLSFYTARKFAATSLETQQLKQEMSQQNTTVLMGSRDSSIFNHLLSNNILIKQLTLPPFGNFHHHTIVQSREEDNGFSYARDGSDSGPGWGVQTSIDAFLASRILLPSQPELLKGVLQNFLDQQSDNGCIDMLTSWTGRRSGMNATPLLAGLVLEVYSYTQDKDWLTRCFPLLLLNFKDGFSFENDRDQDGFPEWQHLLQTGLSDEFFIGSSDKQKREMLIKCTESPALTALLFKECNCLTIMAREQDDPEAAAWLAETSKQLYENIQSCWNEEESFFQYRDMLNHTLNHSNRTITYKRNGSYPVREFKSFTRFTTISVICTDDSPPSFEIQLKASKQTYTLAAKSFTFKNLTGSAVLDSPLGEITSISINGLKKNESVSFQEADLTSFDPSAIIPFWAGAASKDQFYAFLAHKLPILEEMINTDKQFPSVYKIMLLETLVDNAMKKEALEKFDKMYGIFDEQTGVILHSRRTLNDLIPARVLLALFGIDKWNPQEIELEIDDTLLPPITVQYGQTTIEFLQGIRIITHANGDSITLNQAGKTKVLTA